MIAVDTNLLVYAHREDSPFHEGAYRSIAMLAEGRAPWCIPWPCVHEFIAIATHPRIYRPPSSVAQALEQLAAWMESPSLTMLAEPLNYRAVFEALLTQSDVRGAAVHDARIAALCLAHGVRELWSADRDFGRFKALRVVNPLVG